MTQPSQADWIEQDSGLGLVTVGHRVRTNYDTGPYRIINVLEGCTCPEYVRSLNGDSSPSEPHCHITCVDMQGRRAWLNGYRKDGTSVWNQDRLLKAE